MRVVLSFPHHLLALPKQVLRDNQNIPPANYSITGARDSIGAIHFYRPALKDI